MHRLCYRWRFPLPRPPHLISGYLVLDFPGSSLRSPDGSGLTSRGRSAKQKSKQVGRQMTPGALCPERPREESVTRVSRALMGSPAKTLWESNLLPVGLVPVSYLQKLLL